jgi:hypothetical protein
MLDFWLLPLLPFVALQLAAAAYRPNFRGEGPKAR